MEARAVPDRQGSRGCPEEATAAGSPAPLSSQAAGAPAGGAVRVDPTKNSGYDRQCPSLCLEQDVPFSVWELKLVHFLSLCIGNPRWDFSGRP